MSCDYSTGRAIPCKDAIGGIKAIYLVTDGTSALTLTAEDITLDSGSDCQVDDIDTSITVYQIDLPRNTANFSQTLENSIENGSFFYNQSLEIHLHKLEHETACLLHNVAKNYQSVLIHLENDTVLLAGYERGLGVSGGETTVGAGLNDGQKFTLTLQSETRQPVLYLAPTSGAGTTDYPFDGLTTSANVTVSATQVTPDSVT
jgi:hypothetical protein